MLSYTCETKFFCFFLQDTCSYRIICETVGRWSHKRQIRKGGNCDALQLEGARGTARSRSGLLLAKSELRMRRNYYSQASGQNSDAAIRFGDLDFLYGIDILAIDWHSPCDLDLWSFDVKHVMSHVALRTGIICIKLNSVNLPVRDLQHFYCWFVTSCCDLDLWRYDLEHCHAILLYQIWVKSNNPRWVIAI